MDVVNRRVHHRGDHQIPGDDEHPTGSFESEVATHDPKNIDEDDCSQHCLQQSDGEVDGCVCRNPCIFGDPVLRVLVVARNEVKLAVAAVGEPERDQVPAQPLAPFALSRHAAPNSEDRENSAGGDERGKYQSLPPELRAVLSLKCVEKVAVPDIQAVLHQQSEEHDNHEQRDQSPNGQRAPPESRGTLPKAREKALPLRNRDGM